LERVAFLSWHWRIKPCRNDSYRNENPVVGLIAAFVTADRVLILRSKWSSALANIRWQRLLVL